MYTAKGQWAVVDTVMNEYSQIYFYNNQIGFISSYDFYKQTNDGGQTWTHHTTNLNHNRHNFYFLSNDTGFSHLGTTHDGGLNWMMPSNFTYTFCFTENNRYGFSAAYLPFGNPFPTFKSVNGGKDWSTAGTATPDNNAFSTGVRGIHFADSKHGMMVSGEGHIYRTTNGGSNWTLTRPLGSGYDMTGVFMVDSSTAYIYAYNPNLVPFGSNYDKFLRTNDGGITWQSTNIPSNMRQVFTKIQFFGNLKGYYTDGYRLYKTTDGAITWQADTTVYGVKDFSFVDEQTVFLLTWDSVFFNGSVMKRDLTDGIENVTVTEEAIQISPNPFSSVLEIRNRDSNSDATPVEVFDITGRKIYELQMQSVKFKIETSHWLPGFYYLKHRHSVQKLVKQ
jgi:photosystem II stability/assembly factor-like uncharacterized protein